MGVGAHLVLVVGVLGLDLEGVGTEVVTLGLEKVGREILRAVSVEPRQGSGESRGRDSEQGSLGNHVSPAGLCGVDGLVEEVVEEQVLEVGVVSVGGSDVLQEDGADNAATSPHQGDRRLVELPLVLSRGLVIFGQQAISETGKKTQTSCINMKP